MDDPVRDPLIARFGLQPLPGATRVTDAQIEQARQEANHRRWLRTQAVHDAVAEHLRKVGTRDYSAAFGYIQRTRPELFARMQVPAGLPAVESPRQTRRLAVNDAVAAYRRESGTRDYQAAFTHILRTRQDLFAGMQDPSGVVAAANFNPYHDPLGRFTTSDEAVDPHGREHRSDRSTPSPGFAATGQAPHLDYTTEPTQQQGTQAQSSTASNRPVESIRDRAWGSPSNATCSATGLRTLIATAKGQSKEAAPTLEDVESKVEAEVKKLNPQIKAAIEKYNASEKDPAKKLAFIPVTINWSTYGVSAQGGDYAMLMRNVLSQYGVGSTDRQGYDPKKRISMKELADTLIAKGTPAMLNVGENPSNEHAVTVQWEPRAGTNNQGQFLVNNLIAQGGTKEFTRREFESGTLRDNEMRTRGSAVGRKFDPTINLKAPIIFIEKP